MLSWTGEPNPMGAEPRPASSETAATNAGLAGGSVLLLLLAAGYRRWHRGRELEAA